MKYLFPVLAAAAGLALCADPAQDKMTAPVISDKDRANFLIVERGWSAVQKQYEAAFVKEPSVITFEAEAKKMHQVCGKVPKYHFDPQTVQCVKDLEPTTPAKK